MPKLEISHRVYARPTLFYTGLDRYLDNGNLFLRDEDGVLLTDEGGNFLTGTPDGSELNKLTKTIYGCQFNWVTGFYLSAEGYLDPSIITYVDAFSSYEEHISSLYPPFSGYPLNYTILNNETAIIEFDRLSSFSNYTLIAVNPAGYYSEILL